jgi:peptide subunit release factor RF-3
VDLAARIHQLEEMVRDAKSMPLSSSALLNRDEVLELIEQMKDSLPDEIKQARWIVKDREELLAKARRDAEAIVEQARDEQLRLASHEAVVQRAQEESERILQEA